jgi:5-methylcytosine-specific restriction endonuclease McrA
MKRHVKLYLGSIDYAPWYPCEVCSATAVDIHHIDPKGMGGRKSADYIENLIALCRNCHEAAHAGKISKERLKEITTERIDRCRKVTNLV